MTLLRVAGVIFDDGGRILVLRKRGASRFTLPGGKLDADETALDAAIREVYEELRLVLRPADLRLLGTVQGVAANEAGTPIQSTVFVCPGIMPTGAHAEIEETRRIDVGLHPDDDAARDVSPLLTCEILPLYRETSIQDGGD